MTSSHDHMSEAKRLREELLDYIGNLSSDAVNPSKTRRGEPPEVAMVDALIASVSKEYRRTGCGEATDLPAGRELDALVAEKVMGLAYRRYPSVYLNGKWVEGETWIPVHDFLEPGHLPPGGRVGMGPPRYSTDIAAAWEVIGKLVRRGFMPEVNNTGLNEWRCCLWGSYAEGVDWPAMATAQTAPHAICLAALRAVAA